MFREEMKDTSIGKVLQPGAMFTINGAGIYNMSAFCCCEENGCTIFWDFT